MTPSPVSSELGLSPGQLPMFVHCSTWAFKVGDWVTPYDERGAKPRSWGGSPTRALELGQTKRRVVFVFEIEQDEDLIFRVSGFEWTHWDDNYAYEVVPDGPLEPDCDERVLNALPSSQMCARAQIVRVIRRPGRSTR